MNGTASEAICTTALIDIYCPESTVPKITVSALSDLHRGVKSHSKSRFSEVITNIRARMKKNPQHYVVFVGDNVDKFSDSERKGLGLAALHASSVESIDEWIVKDYLEPLAKDLEFMGDRNLGFVGGNHAYVFQTDSEEWGYRCGMTAEQWLAKRLKTRWLGWICYMRLAVHRGAGRGNVGAGTVSLDFVVCHGKGGGKLAGSTINGVEDLRRIFPSAHCYFAGHDHQLGVVPVSMLEVPSGWGARTAQQGITSLANLKIRQHDQLLCRCGSFLKAYEPGRPSYVVRALMRPACLGYVEIVAKLMRRRTDDGVRYMEWQLDGTVKSGGSRAAEDD